MKITLDRSDVCKLLIATTACSSESEYWKKLHDKIKEQLDEWDVITWFSLYKNAYGISKGVFIMYFLFYGKS